MNDRTDIGLGVLLGVVGSFLAVAFLTGIAGLDSHDDLQQQQDLYCEMVAIHKDTGGQYGWPDYKRIAERVCK